MKHAKYFFILIFLATVWPVNGQTRARALDYFNRAEERCGEADYAGAIANYTKAIEIDPRYAEAYDNRARARDAKYDFEIINAEYKRTAPPTKADLNLALADFTKAIEIDPRYVLAYLDRGDLREKMQDLDGASADFTKVIDLKPAKSDFLAGLSKRGHVRMVMQNTDAAIADLTRAIQLGGGPGEYYDRGKVRSMTGDYAGAIADFTNAVAYSTDDPLPIASLAWLLATTSNATLRNGKKAVAYATEACELTNWNDPFHIAILAAAYAEVGDFDAAVKWQTKAMTYPDYVQSSAERGPMYLQLFKQRKAYHDVPPKARSK